MTQHLPEQVRLKGSLHGTAWPASACNAGSVPVKEGCSTLMSEWQNCSHVGIQVSAGGHHRAMKAWQVNVMRAAQMLLTRSHQQQSFLWQLRSRQMHYTPRQAHAYQAPDSCHSNNCRSRIAACTARDLKTTWLLQTVQHLHVYLGSSMSCAGPVICRASLCTSCTHSPV